jgi:hypothetical protein
MWVREWLLVAVALCTAANAAPPAPAVPPVQPGAQSAPVGTQPPPAGTPPPPSQGAPDGDFIEFLGGDDVGDAAWWEFLKKVPPRGVNSPAAPPLDAKQ